MEKHTYHMRKEVVSVQHLIVHTLRSNSNRTILTEVRGYRTIAITGSELEAKISHVQALLKKKHITKNDKVILIGRNSHEWLAVYFACILSGVTVVPLDTLTNAPLLRKIQHQVRAKAVFADPTIPSLRIPRCTLSSLGAASSSARLGIIPIHPQDVLEIQYTSGTTDQPKGVILTHGNIAAAIAAAASIIRIPLRLRMLNTLPLSHIFSQVYGIFLFLHHNQQIFFLDNLQPHRLITCIRLKRLHGMLAVPGIVTALKEELHHASVMRRLGVQFRLIGVGGAPLDTVAESWWKRRGVLVQQGYGLTETASVVAVSALGASKTGSVGIIPPMVTIKISPTGEILVKGKNVTPGYYHNKEKTRQSFEHGWLKTGDRGEMKKGYLFMKGRLKDMILTPSGLNVYPADIEAVLNKMPEVKESCVIERDNTIHAVLILAKQTNLTTLIRNANKQLLTNQQIAGATLWPYTSFPKTPLDKIQKYRVIQEISMKQKPPQQQYDPLLNLISTVLRVNQKLHRTSKLTDLGMDSLKRVELIAAIEKECAVELDEVSITPTTTISDLKQLILHHPITRTHFTTWQLHPIIKLLRFIIQHVFFFPFLSLVAPSYAQGIHRLRTISPPVIFVSNHQSALDSPFILKHLPFPVATAADATILFGIGTHDKGCKKLLRTLTGVLTKLFLNTYPFGPAIGTRMSLEFTGELIDRGYSILIFPEGRRTRTGALGSFRSGIGYLALYMHAPLVPLKIRGLYEVLPINRIIPKPHKCSITIGKPIATFPSSYLKATKLIERKVREL